MLVKLICNDFSVTDELLKIVNGRMNNSDNIALSNRKYYVVGHFFMDTSWKQLLKYNSDP